MPRFRSVPSAVHDSPEWVRASALARTVHRCMRPSAGVLALHAATPGEPLWRQLQRKASEGCADYSPEECQSIVNDCLSTGLWLELEGVLVIPAFPPSFENEREQRKLGAHGGLPRAEIQKAYRARIAATKHAGASPSTPPPAPPLSSPPSTPSEASAPPSPPALLFPTLTGQDKVTSTVTGNVTGNTPSEGLEAPSPTPPAPPKGVQGGKGPGRADEKRELEIGTRSAAELAELADAAVGDLAVRILARAPGVFAVEASAGERRSLGAVVKALGYPELELRAVAAHWLKAPDEARKLFRHDEIVRNGGRITIGVLVGKADAKGVCSGKGLRRAREVAVPWADQRKLFDKHTGPGPVKSDATAVTPAAVGGGGGG